MDPRYYAIYLFPLNQGEKDKAVLEYGRRSSSWFGDPQKSGMTRKDLACKVMQDLHHQQWGFGIPMRNLNLACRLPPNFPVEGVRPVPHALTML